MSECLKVVDTRRRGDEINTEDLRVALKKYRSFFQKLMSV